MNVKNLLGLIMLTLVLSIPSTTFAATVKDTSSAHIDELALISDSSKPKIFGTAVDTKSLKINIYKASSTKVIYKSKTIKVKDGEWKTRVSKKLPNGTYTVIVYGSKGVSRDTLSTQTLIVDTDKKTIAKANTTFVVEQLPFLTGGVARANAALPVAYLQVTNVGKDSAILKGFWLKQNGSASEKSIIGLSTVDETGTIRATTGGVEGASPFKNNTAFAPVPDVVFEAGQMKLFTIKANMSSTIDSYIGTQLMIDVESVDISALVKAQFPIRGTTWTISR